LAEQDYTVRPKGANEVCRECGSEPPMHFGSCSQHPTNLAMAGRKVEDTVSYPEDTLPQSRPQPPQTYPVNNWLGGSEMKVTEDFLKAAVSLHTGAKVASVKFKGKAFVVKFE